MGVDIFFVGDSWVEAAIQLKRNMVITSIFDIIIDKFQHLEKPSLFIFFIVDKVLEIGFHYTILLLCLIVCLGVKCDRKSSINTKKVIK